jgi:AcrR family transcriptional regulator
MPRISKAPEERRQELIDTAAELFWKQGYEKTMVSDIVKQVGVAQGLFYYYFESKQDIFMTVIDQSVQIHVEELAVIMRDETCSPVTRMRNVVTALSGFLRKVDAVGPHAHVDAGTDMGRKIQRHVMEMMEPFVTQALTEGAEQGLLDAPHPAHIARFILSGFIGVESWPGAPQADEMIELVLRLLERLLLLPIGSLEGTAADGALNGDAADSLPPPATEG